MSLCIVNRIMNEYVSEDTLLQSVDELDYNLSFDSINDEQQYRERLSLEFKKRLQHPVNPLLKLSQEELAKLKQLYDYEIAYEDYDSDNYDTDDSGTDINEDNKDQEDDEDNDDNNNYNEEEEEEAIFELEV